MFTVEKRHTKLVLPLPVYKIKLATIVGYGAGKRMLSFVFAMII